MKLIIAMIQPEKLDAVQAALEQTEAPLIYAGQVLDLRDQTAEMYRGSAYRAARIKMRLELLVINDMLIEETVGAIARALCGGDARPYEKGNILVMTVEEWIPIRGSEPRFAHAVAA